MEIRFGLISADSHVVTDRNAFLDRMSKSKFGERIPQVREVESQRSKNRPLGRQRTAAQQPRRSELSGGNGRSRPQRLPAKME